MDQANNRKVMLTFSAGEWSGVQHRPHHFMKRSAKSGWKVIYVEPPATLIAPLKNRETLKVWDRWLKGVKETEDGIYVLTPPPILPFGNKYRIINKINQWIISKSIRKFLKKQPNAVLDLYTFLPNSVDLLKYFSFNKVIYDCVDDHGSFTGLINPEIVNQMEKELMANTDVCFATAKQLLEDRKEWSTNFHLVPNGAEYEHFAPAQKGGLPYPIDIEPIKKPIVGFYGGISDWIDIPLITEVAAELPNVSFVFIGPVDTSVKGLKELPNVSFLGTKSYNNLPNYLQAFDICLVPFRINKLTKSVNPIKLYEYLSAGKPVVSTPLPEVLNYSDVVEIGESKEQLIAIIEKQLEEKDKDIDVMKRQEVGRNNSWDSRWETVLSKIT
ncbi:glycosyltransferase [Ferdinandcohnia sp. Marseille-Q9671]